MSTTVPHRHPIRGLVEVQVHAPDTVIGSGDA